MWCLLRPLSLSFGFLPPLFLCPYDSTLIWNKHSWFDLILNQPPLGRCWFSCSEVICCSKFIKGKQRSNQTMIYVDEAQEWAQIFRQPEMAAQVLESPANGVRIGLSGGGVQFGGVDHWLWLERRWSPIPCWYHALLDLQFSDSSTGQLPRFGIQVQEETTTH